MKYIVDSALCCGHGQCHAVAPEVYSLDEDGYNAAAGSTVEVPPSLEDAAERGAAACPESAIVTFE